MMELQEWTTEVMDGLLLSIYRDYANNNDNNMRSHSRVMPLELGLIKRPGWPKYGFPCRDQGNLPQRWELYSNCGGLIPAKIPHKDSNYSFLKRFPDGVLPDKGYTVDAALGGGLLGLMPCKVPLGPHYLRAVRYFFENDQNHNIQLYPEKNPLMGSKRTKEDKSSNRSSSLPSDSEVERETPQGFMSVEERRRIIKYHKDWVQEGSNAKSIMKSLDQHACFGGVSPGSTDDIAAVLQKAYDDVNGDLVERLDGWKEYLQYRGVSDTESPSSLLSGIINLTQSPRFYDHRGYDDIGVAPVQVVVSGGGQRPEPKVVWQFFETIQALGRLYPGTVSLIHCTHGVNRTGFFCCLWLIAGGGLSVQNALDLFASVRGHSIDKPELVSFLQSFAASWKPVPGVEPAPHRYADIINMCLHYDDAFSFLVSKYKERHERLPYVPNGDNMDESSVDVYYTIEIGPLPQGYCCELAIYIAFRRLLSLFGFDMVELARGKFVEIRCDKLKDTVTPYIATIKVRARSVFVRHCQPINKASAQLDDLVQILSNVRIAREAYELDASTYEYARESQSIRRYWTSNMRKNTLGGHLQKLFNSEYTVFMVQIEDEHHSDCSIRHSKSVDGPFLNDLGMTTVTVRAVDAPDILLDLCEAIATE